MLVKIPSRRSSSSCQYNQRNPRPIILVRRMNKKFGAGKPPTGTPSLAWSCVVVIISLLSGASIVHNIYKPDLRLPAVETVDTDDDKDHEVQAQKQ